MNLYNKVMIYFWLGLSIVSAISVTYFGATEGFDRWFYYYAVSAISLIMYFFKKFMISRMENHLKYLEEQRKNKK